MIYVLSMVNTMCVDVENVDSACLQRKGKAAEKQFKAKVTNKSHSDWFTIPITAKVMLITLSS